MRGRRRITKLAIAIAASLAVALFGGGLGVSGIARAESSAKARPSLAAGATWRFAVSGDSRNCGDIVMPAIAAGAKRDKAEFYWHLGDFRRGSAPDEDLVAEPEHRASPPALDAYRKIEWQDFISAQLDPFGNLPVFLGIGNHELAGHNRDEYRATFAEWLTAQPIKQARAGDGDQKNAPETYYHWYQNGIDFVTLDNGDETDFDSAQMSWFGKVMARDEADPKVTTIVLGMHKALPDSISEDHSMAEGNHPVPVNTGREVYKALLRTQNESHKKVYILASHSHYYMQNIFNTAYWRANGGVLPGWIIGTAGAQHYPLPEAWRDADQAMELAYGYLLATVNPRATAGQPGDGSIWFEFKIVNKSDVPPAAEQRFGAKQVDYCFEQNFKTK